MTQMTVDPHHAFDRLRTAQAGQRWPIIQDLFRQEGIAWVTAGTAPRTRIEAVTVQTSLPERVMNDYIGEKLYVDDPWMAHSAASTSWDTLDIETGRPSLLTARCRRLQSVFADHGLRQVCLVPAYGGHRPGALVLYANGREEAQALRNPGHLQRLRLLTAIVAAHWRPEVPDASNPVEGQGSYMFNPILSPREAEVLSWLAQGLDGARIAHRMGIAPVTVAKHLRMVRRKLGAQTREQALAVAIRDGLITP